MRRILLLCFSQRKLKLCWPYKVAPPRSKRVYQWEGGSILQHGFHYRFCFALHSSEPAHSVLKNETLPLWGGIWAWLNLGQNRSSLEPKSSQRPPTVHFSKSFVAQHFLLCSQAIALWINLSCSFFPAFRFGPYAVSLAQPLFPPPSFSQHQGQTTDGTKRSAIKS